MKDNGLSDRKCFVVVCVHARTCTCTCTINTVGYLNDLPLYLIVLRQRAHVYSHVHVSGRAWESVA